MTEYNKSKKQGDVGEAEIMKRFQKRYPKAFIDNIGKANSKWDIWIPEINEGIEVKQDYKSFETGNLVIEVEMKGKLSALSVTKAIRWVFITGFRYIWVTPLEIYRFMEQHIAYGRTQWIGTGDKHPKIAHLINHNRFVLYVNNLDNKDGLVEMINKDDIMYYYNFIKKYGKPQ